MLILVTVYLNKYKSEYQRFISFHPKLTYKDRLWMIEELEKLTDTQISVDKEYEELFKKGYKLKELLSTICKN